MRKAGVATLLAVLVALSACTSTPSVTSGPVASSTTQPSLGPTSSSAPSGSSSPTASPAPSPSGATLASGEELPACVPGAPAPSDTVTFVASGHAWALNPSDGHLTCLFAVTDAGPFAWGPLGDRALVAGLEVKGVAGGPNVAGSDRTFATLAWSRPTGKSIVYAPGADTSLKKLHIDGSPTQDVSPLPSSKYLSVTYHPSGEAFAFAVERDGAESIWIASNTGKTPVQVVFSNEGTKFGAIAFDVDGKHLFYAAQHADNHPELHTIDVTDATKAPVVWSGEVGRKTLDIEPGLTTGTVAWTSGAAACADSIAMVHSPAGTAPVLPGGDGPTRSVGWLGATQLLVAAGGCGKPLSLSAVDIASGTIVPLVSGVDVAAVRTPVPTPPAPLPAAVASLGSGFS